MIVCHCKVVNDATITRAVEEGAVTLAEVCRTTGAGTDCGGCVFTVKALVCEHDVSRARTMDDLRALSIDEETIRAAS
ncbi:(2Fe-2S)-binding protein [Phycicoccus sp. HDW14]|uniref:(2Fe-2S)-binding protein n=1 Tax=Phycicoccus sp. HDW14 TaxID=2714941 RepID=UPI00140B7413|nr:(2Fe-2S)-binding protein [Phycicoccus sp. HDW14]QIM22337.1 (2Fe-2S)-binding protein [Phycicoccus sp. HDW14]